MPSFARLSLSLFVVACASASSAAAPLHAGPMVEPPDYRSMKYGLFVHYVWGGSAYTATINRDGSKPADLDDLADRFDATGFAGDLAAMGVEYVLFTAWHAGQNVLYPSKVMEKWMPGHSAKRDLIGDMIRACHSRGIQVLLYTHPRDGHDFSAEDQARTGWSAGQGADPDWSSFDKEKWNHFINEVYAELVERYGGDILGLYLDEGSASADSQRVVDYPRLRKTITDRHPHLLMMQNDYGNLYTADLGNREIFYNHAYASPDGDQWNSSKIPISIVTGSIFWAAFPEGQSQPAQKSGKVGFNPKVEYSPESMFRYTVLQAGTNRDGGGVLWAAGPYAGGGWESGVRERLQAVGKLLAPVSEAIKNTRPSTSWPTRPGSTIADLSWGVAVTSANGRTEYLHVLKPPRGSRRLSLPPPADGSVFTGARLLTSGTPVALKHGPAGVELDLPEGSEWDRLDTVFALAVSAESPACDLALWRGGRASSHADNPHHPSKATDGETSTSWSSAAGDTDPWFAVDLAAPSRALRVEIVGNIGSGDVIELSDDFGFSASTGIEVQTTDHVPGLADGEGNRVRIALPADRAFRHIRVLRKAASSPMTISECRVYESCQ